MSPCHHCFLPPRAKDLAFGFFWKLSILWISRLIHTGSLEQQTVLVNKGIAEWSVWRVTNQYSSISLIFPKHIGLYCFSQNNFHSFIVQIIAFTCRNFKVDRIPRILAYLMSNVPANYNYISLRLQLTVTTWLVEIPWIWSCNYSFSYNLC